MSTGLEDLLRRFSGSEPRVALLLVKTGMGPVVSGLADAYGMAPLLEEASVKEGRAGSFQSSSWMAAVQLREEPWVCVYVAIEEVNGLDQELVRQVAADLSETLSTEALSLVIAPKLVTDRPESESSGDPVGDPEATWVHFELFSHGKVADLVRWQVDGPMDVFQCSLREPPENTEKVPIDLVNRLASDRGILVPACCPRGRGELAWLEIWDLDPQRVLRADLFRLRGSSFFDDETLEMTLDEVDESSEEPTRQEAGAAETGDGPLVATEEPAEAPRSGGLREIFRRFIGKD